MNNFVVKILPFLFLALISCEEAKIDLYDSGHYVQFTSKNSDTTLVSFFLYPDLSEIKVPLEMRLIGKMSFNDLRCSIRVKEDETDVSSEYYTISTDFLFTKGQPLDTMFVVFHKKPDLTTTKKMFTIEIMESSDVRPGQSNYIKRIFYISDMIEKPNWWDRKIEMYGLGKYSDKKYRLFIEVTGEGELYKFNEYEKRSLMLQFKYYLIEKKNEGNSVLDDDGNDMLSTIRILG